MLYNRNGSGMCTGPRPQPPAAARSTSAGHTSSTAPSPPVWFSTATHTVAFLEATANSIENPEPCSKEPVTRSGSVSRAKGEYSSRPLAVVKLDSRTTASSFVAVAEAETMKGP